jgi:hypothetical protein
MSAVQEIAEIWGEDTDAAKVAKLMPDILEMDEDPIAVVDRIIEAGYYDDSLELSPEALDQIQQLAVDAADDASDAEAEVEKYSLAEHLAAEFAARGFGGPVRYSKDASGHEHKGAGAGGGQFTGTVAPEHRQAVVDKRNELAKSKGMLPWSSGDASKFVKHGDLAKMPLAGHDWHSSVAKAAADHVLGNKPVDHETFEADLNEAFDKLDTKGRNFTTIADLRDALPQYSREQFEAGVNQLRKADKFTAEAIYGESAAGGPEAHAKQRAGGMKEGNTVLAHLSRRTDRAH